MKLATVSGCFLATLGLTSALVIPHTSRDGSILARDLGRTGFAGQAVGLPSHDDDTPPNQRSEGQRLETRDPKLHIHIHLKNFLKSGLVKAVEQWAGNSAIGNIVKTEAKQISNVANLFDGKFHPKYLPELAKGEVQQIENIASLIIPKVI